MTTRAEDLAKLQGITDLVLENRLHRLRQTAEARAQSLMQLAALSATPVPADLPAITAGLVGLTYQRWADIRRAELNAVIARQTAEWMAAKAEASLAFGRAEAVRGVAAKAARR
jgi:hypothetical protein